jgi:hypothetical protein
MVSTNQAVEAKAPEVTPTTEAPAQQAPGPGQVQINIDFLKTTRVHICMPCYGGMLTESTFMSYIKWANTARQLGIDWTMETMTNESLISRARNTLTAKFLSNPDSTHLMFIDADIGWEPWHLLVMLNRDVDVIGGLYPMKSLPVKWCVNGFEGAEEGPDGLQEVTKTGTGFLLMKRGVFEKLNAHPAVKPFNSDIGLPPELNVYMKTYFDTAVRENRYYSEDWTFCENWRDLGGKVWVDKRVLLRHTGTYVFDFATQDQLYKDLHEIVVNNQAQAQAVAQATGVAPVPAMAAPVDTAAVPAPTAPAAKVIASSKGKKKK